MPKDRENINPLDLSINAILDASPRKMGRKLKALCTRVFGQDDSDLKKEITELRKAIEKLAKK